MLNFMTNSWINKNGLLFGRGFRGLGGLWGLVCGVALLWTGCTDRDDMFGNGMVPPAQQMGSEIDSTITVWTRVAVGDSLDTNIAGYYQPYMGSYVDPVVGRTDVAVFSNYSPEGFKHTHYFGENPVIDSMRYAIAFAGVTGDTAKSVIVDVFEVKSGVRFYQDSAYFSNFDMRPYIDEDKPLFSFEQKGVKTALGRLPQEFAERLLDNTQSQENVYYNDTTFHRRFSGFYFRLREPAEAGSEGLMLQFDLSQSMMFLFYHNSGPGEEADSALQQKIFFYNGDMTYDYVSFSTVGHDYALADQTIEGTVRVNAAGEPVQTDRYVYVQGLAGLMGEIEVDRDDLKALQERAKAMGYSHIALHRAALEVTMVDAGEEQYDRSFSSLGMYYDLGKYEFLSEYNPVLEAANTGYKSTLGGALNRSLGVYRFDVTSHVQKLLTGREERSVQLLPSFAERNSLRRAWIYGTGSEYPPRLVLTYTMIK